MNLKDCNNSTAAPTASTSRAQMLPDSQVERARWEKSGPVIITWLPRVTATGEVQSEAGAWMWGGGGLESIVLAVTDR